jgi:hypothetical protein
MTRLSWSHAFFAIAVAAGGCAARAPAQGEAVTAGSTAVPQLVAACPTLPAPRVWRLTHAQLRNTLVDVFGFVGPAVDALPPDSRLEGFANGSERLGVPPLLLEYYYKVSDEISTDVIRRSGEFLECKLAALGEGRCLRRFLDTVGLRAWRRPLTAEEAARLGAVYATAARAGGPELGLKMLLEAVLVSPNFLYRFELGDQRQPGALTQLTDYELASALSYTLWDGPPDAKLYALAAAGKLTDPAVRKAEAARLFASLPRAPAALTSFIEQWLRTDGLPAAGKDPMMFPMYDKQVARDLLGETRRLVESVVFEPGGDRSLHTLLTVPYGYVNSKTAKIYGVKRRGGDLAKTDLDPHERRGLLTQAAFLAAHADADTTRVVDRGKFVREDVLCGEVPPPPDDFKFDETKITDDMTAREKLTEHAKNPFCANCHALFDGIGFALEAYDAVGRYRTTDKDKPLDLTGSLPLPDGTTLYFASFVDLVEQLSARREPYACFASHYIGYATGRAAKALAACEREPILRAFFDSGYRLDALVMAVIASPGFAVRRN